MKAFSIRDMVNKYCAETPEVRPIALRIRADAEENWIKLCFPHLLGLSRKRERIWIERHFKSVKPSGIEIIIWNQDVNEVSYAIPSRSN